MAVTLLVRLTAKPGQGPNLRKLLLGPTGAGKVEGYLGIKLCEDINNPDEFVLVEEWTAVAAHKRHLSELMAKQGLAPVEALLAVPASRRYYAEVFD